MLFLRKACGWRVLQFSLKMHLPILFAKFTMPPSLPARLALRQPVCPLVPAVADADRHQRLFLAALMLLCWLQLMLDLLKTAEEKGGVIGALTFGVQLPSGWQAFPSSPTWLLHDSGEAVRRCYANVPIVLRTSTFCEVCCCPSSPCPPQMLRPPLSSQKGMRLGALMQHLECFAQSLGIDCGKC